ncbi:MAG TPA: D-aminoacylase [Vicinamibacterales bacterium]
MADSRRFARSTSLPAMRWGLVALAGAVLAGWTTMGVPAQEARRYDLLLRGGHVIDGTGSPWVKADVAVTGDTIVAIAPRIDGPAARVIDVTGLVVSPGFIDIHTHARRGIFEVPTADNYTRQGVTTIYEGPDGSSPLPIKAFLDRVAATRVSPNFGTFVGQGSAREQVIGTVDRKATPAEIDRMRELVRQGMLDGAVGLSTGLFYVPGIFTPTDEVVELAKVAGAMGGIHVSHMRNEATGVLDSVRETIAIGERGGLPTQVTHHKIIGVQNWGKSVDTVKLVLDARARGVDVTIDQYPYTASATGINALFPPWALEGGRADVVGRLNDPAQRQRIKATVIDNIKFDRGGGDPKNISVSSCPWDASLAGKNLAEITRLRGQDPTIDNAAETTMWIVEKGGASGIFHAIDEKDLERIIACPVTMIASDGEVPVFGRNAPHPRSYGTFARVLAVYVREKGVLSLEEGVRKMTSLPAWRLGLPDRGILRPGMKADIAVFDPVRVRDTATFDRPHQYAEGFAHVIVNGQIIYEKGAMTPARPGRILYGPAKQK